MLLFHLDAEWHQRAVTNSIIPASEKGLNFEKNNIKTLIYLYLYIYIWIFLVLGVYLKSIDEVISFLFLEMNLLL